MCCDFLLQCFVSLKIIRLMKGKSLTTVYPHSLITAWSQSLITILFLHSPIHLSIDVSMQGEKATSNKPHQFNNSQRKSMNNLVILKKIQRKIRKWQLFSPMGMNHVLTLSLIVCKESGLSLSHYMLCSLNKAVTKPVWQALQT